MFKITDYEINSINNKPNDLIPKYIKYTNVEKLWELGYKGEDIKIGIIDTGIADHVCLTPKVIKGKNFTNEGSVDDFRDLNGHGTNVASIIGACPDGIHDGIYGVAPNCGLYIAKCLTKSGNGDIGWISNALRWLIEENVDLINMSLGSSEYSKEIDELIELAIDKDILCVVAAGNEGDFNSNTNEKSYPAYLNNSIAVGAIDTDNTVTKFSNSNDEIDCVAPGYNIVGCYLNNKFASTSGTSQSAPCVSGFLALLKQKFIAERNRKPSEMELYAHLIKHCKDIGLDFKFQGEGAICYE